MDLLQTAWKIVLITSIVFVYQAVLKHFAISKQINNLILKNTKI